MFHSMIMHHTQGKKRKINEFIYTNNSFPWSTLIVRSKSAHFSERMNILHKKRRRRRQKKKKKKYKEYLSKCDNVVPFIKIAQIFITFIPYINVRNNRCSHGMCVNTFKSETDLFRLQQQQIETAALH